jgi:fibronectin-binding autotransporter adhesin
MNRPHISIITIVAILVGAILAGPGRAGTINWDGDNSVGNLSYDNNWYGNSDPDSFGGWVYGNDLQFNLNNGGASSLYYDYGTWHSINSISYEGTFPSALTLNGDGNGLNFNTKIENNSSHAQTLNIPTSGAKNGAGTIQLNPVSNDLTIASTVFNDNNKYYEVYGDNGNSLIVSGTLSRDGGDVGLTLQANSTVVISNAQSALNDDFYINEGTLRLAVDSAIPNVPYIRLQALNGSAYVNLDGGQGAANGIITSSDNSTTKMLANMPSTSGTATYSGNMYLDSPLTLYANSGGTVALTGTTLDLKNQTLTVDGAGTSTISGTLQQSTGSGKLVKNGAGTLTLSTDMTYSGGTTVNGGELLLDSGDNTLNSGSFLTIDGASSVVRLGPTATGNNIFGSGPLTIQNGGTLSDDTSIGTVHSVNGGLTFNNGGTLTAGGSGYNGSYGNYHITTDVDVTGNAAATISADAITLAWASVDVTVADVTGDSDADLTVSSVIRNWAGGGANPSYLNKAGAGTMVLTAQSTYTGGTTVNGGVLELSGGTDRIDGAVVVDGSGVVKVSNNSHNNINSIDSITLQNGGTFTDNSSGGFVQSIPATVSFNNGGTMTSTAAGNASYGNFFFHQNFSVSGSGLATISAQAISLNGARTVTVADTVAGAATDLLISSIVRPQNGTSLTKAGDGTMTLTGANTYDKPVNVNAGTLELQNGSALGDASLVTVNASGTLEVDDAETIGRLTGAGDVTLNATLTCGDTTSSEVSGDISGAGGLVKQGASTLTLSGDNSSFSGGITLNNSGSTLSLNSANAAGSGPLSFGYQTHLYNGASGPDSIDNDISFGDWFYWDSGSKALTVNGACTVASDVFWANSANTLTLAGVVSGSSKDRLRVYSTGTLALTNPNNDFTSNPDPTYGATIQFATIANSGVNSSLGAGTTLHFDYANQDKSGYYECIGAGGSSDRAVTFGAGSGSTPAGIANNGTGALEFSGTFSYLSGAGSAKTLLLGGSYAGTNSISSVLSDGSGGGTLALTKEGTTTWALTGQSTYTGGTTVNDGTLELSGGANRIDGALTVDGSGIVKVSNGAHNNLDTIDSITLQNGGTLTDNSGGTWVQSVNMPFTFNNGGTLTSEPGTDGNGDWGNFLFGSTFSVTGTGLATISANGMGFSWAKTLTVADTVAGEDTDLLISSSIRHDREGTVTKAGAGTVELTGINTDPSVWDIDAGTLKIGGSGQLQSGAYVGNIINDSIFHYASSADQTMSGSMSGSGQLVKTGTGTLTLSNDNSYSGVTTVNEGTLKLTTNHKRNLNTTYTVDGATAVLEGAAYQVFSNFGTAYDKVLTALNGGTIKSSTIAIRIGDVALSDGSSLTAESANGAYGGFYLGRLTGDASPTVTVSGSSASQVDGAGGIAIVSTIFDVADVTSDSGTDLTVSVKLQDMTDASYTGGVEVDGAITKTGAGTMVLSGVNSYEGDTTINNGVLRLASGGSLNTGTSVRIASSGQMELDGGINQTVDQLFFAGEVQASGTWGATGSGADNINDARFAGTGKLTVSNGPGGTLFRFK